MWWHWLYLILFIIRAFIILIYFFYWLTNQKRKIEPSHYFENNPNWCSVSYFYDIPSVISRMLPIDALWVIFIIFLLLFRECYQLMLCELFLLYSFCYFENITNWCYVSYFYYIPSVILKMLLIDALWVISSYSFCYFENFTNWCSVSYFIIFLLLFWKFYQLMLCELFLLFSFCYFKNITNWCSVSYFIIFLLLFQKYY